MDPDDLIIPARYLKRVERTGYGPLLFADKRYEPGGAPPPGGGGPGSAGPAGGGAAPPARFFFAAPFGFFAPPFFLAGTAGSSCA